MRVGTTPLEAELLKSQELMAFIATSNPRRARAFYVDKLGLRLISEDGFAVVLRAGDVTVRVQVVEKFVPHPFTALGWSVTDVDAEVAALRRKRVRMEQFEGMDQAANGVWQSPSGARVAWFRDPDGNILSLTQHPDARRGKPASKR